MKIFDHEDFLPSMRQKINLIGYDMCSEEELSRVIEDLPYEEHAGALHRHFAGIVRELLNREVWPQGVSHRLQEIEDQFAARRRSLEARKKAVEHRQFIQNCGDW